MDYVINFQSQPQDEGAFVTLQRGEVACLRSLSWGQRLLPGDKTSSLSCRVSVP